MALPSTFNVSIEAYENILPTKQEKENTWTWLMSLENTQTRGNKGQDANQNRTCQCYRAQQ